MIMILVRVLDSEPAPALSKARALCVPSRSNNCTAARVYDDNNMCLSSSKERARLGATSPLFALKLHDAFKETSHGGGGRGGGGGESWALALEAPSTHVDTHIRTGGLWMHSLHTHTHPSIHP